MSALAAKKTATGKAGTWSRVQPKPELAIGAIRIDVLPTGKKVRRIKVRMGGRGGERWMRYARWWWLKHKGPIPDGKCVLHLDGDLLNDAPENLVLGTVADSLMIAHADDPAMSDRNRAAMRAGTIEHNKLRSRIARATRWLGSRWYPVDHAARIIYNRPVRHRARVFAAMGFSVPVRLNGSGSFPAALGWPERTLLEACVLAVLADVPEYREIDGVELLARVEKMRAERGCGGTLSRTTIFHAGSSSLRKLGLIATRRMGRNPAMYRITRAGLDARGAWTAVVPVTGRALTAGVCEGYARVDEQMGTRARVDVTAALGMLGRALGDVA